MSVIVDMIGNKEREVFNVFYPFKPKYLKILGG
jgi:mRNA-degrading endonuclease HigB of HigAB toxin-antitoxin module